MFDEILASLPRLRRFGVMLLGSARRTDLLISDCLEIIVDEAATYAKTHDIVVELFALFVKASVDQAHAGNGNGSGDGSDALDKHFPGISFLEKKVFLLRYVEEFDPAFTAKVLDLSERDVGLIERDIELKADEM